MISAPNRCISGFPQLFCLPCSFQFLVADGCEVLAQTLPNPPGLSSSTVLRHPNQRLAVTTPNNQVERAEVGLLLKYPNNGPEREHVFLLVRPLRDPPTQRSSPPPPKALELGFFLSRSQTLLQPFQAYSLGFGDWGWALVVQTAF